MILRYLIFTSVVLGALLVACGESESPGQAASVPLASWSFEDVEYSIVSGIAGAQPEYWLDRGWEGDATIVYLVDRQVGCDDFPDVDDPTRFPPFPVEEGALILLRFTTESSDDRVHYASFDILTIDTSSGAGTDAVVGDVTIVGSGDTRRAEGWIEYEDPGDGSRTPSVSANGAFDVPFCS